MYGYYLPLLRWEFFASFVLVPLVEAVVVAWKTSVLLLVAEAPVVSAARMVAPVGLGGALGVF